MTKKADVKLETYKKAPRCLSDQMKTALLDGGDLAPVLEAVGNDDELRLDIRDECFNVYYGGGNLLKVSGRIAPWKMYFAEKYFAVGEAAAPKLPDSCSSIEVARQWVDSFDALRAGMDSFWAKHGREERDHCQRMARANSALHPRVDSEYLILDIEYEWAHRRFDLIAARRNLTTADQTGWREPHLVFVEVKSGPAACGGNAGLAVHVTDYAAIVQAREGGSADEIKREFEGVVAQKKALGLIEDALPFERFSAEPLALLLVFANIDPVAANVSTYVQRAIEAADAKGLSDTLSVMRLSSDDYLMTEAKAQPLGELKV
jgi:hypothetical protein